MAVQLTPSQLKQYLAAAIPAGLPILITGAPGIGKSDCVTQAAAIAGADCVIMHPAVQDPTDVAGLPWITPDGAARFIPLGQLAQLLSATRLTVCFLDDFGQANESVQKAWMQPLLAREINGHRFPDCVVFIAATNRRGDRAGVGGILEPVKSRFASIVELVPDLDDWTAWAIRSGRIPPELIAFLRFRPSLLSAFLPSADLINCPSPRTWSNAARQLALQLPPALEAVALAGAVGEEAATEFLAFRAMYRQLPSIDAALADPDAAAIPDNPSALWAVVTGLASKANAQTFGRISRYAERLTAAGRGDLGNLLVRDCIRRDPSLQHTPEYIRTRVGEMGALTVGA